MASIAVPAELKNAQALVFDFIGTATDWFTPVSQALIENAPSGSQVDWSSFAHQWRTGFFKLVGDLAANNDIIPLKDVFDRTLSILEKQESLHWTDEQRQVLLSSWVKMIPWEDTVEGIKRLREKYIVVVLSNGSTRVLINTCRQYKMEFDMFFASDVIGVYKPAPITYQTTIKALQVDPAQCIMVAAHAYDLEAAATNGMKTIYITRSTEDIHEQLDKYTFDLTIKEGGLIGLADALLS